ncbi:bacterial-type amidase, putative [Bodo saltans]|uniref:Bacterial-type amidase, putative n=1 Tax=Bodo saltans TaxID=75058 RepID=A0A0S4J7V7_BODSA|nr:bacterial-type amidase, putative [Bodo saltans]|eukprot:CUG87514.1 bacterial-type amidase, putative [Bodo saltans]
MKQSQWWLRDVYDSIWYHFNPMLNQCGWTTLNINELLARVRHPSITAEELLCMHRNQRLLLRGCRDVQYTSTALIDFSYLPLERFPLDEVIGFAKGSGAAGGGGRVDANGKPQKGSFDDALAFAKMLDEFRSKTNDFIKIPDWRRGDDAYAAEQKHKLQQLNETMNRTFAIKPYSEQLLHGVVFDTNGTGVAQALGSQLKRQGADRLKRQGAIHFGTTTMCGEGEVPSTSLPSPYHAAIQVGGSAGSGSLAVLLGMSSFSFGTNGGGSNRISAGLFGLSASSLGASGRPLHYSHGVTGTIARTPLDNALIMNATLRAPMTTQQLVSRFNEALPNDTRIGWLSTLGPEFVEGEKRDAFPGFGGDLLPYVPLHPSVDAAMRDAVVRLERNNVSMTPLNGSIREISHTFFSWWMKYGAKVAEKKDFDKWRELWDKLWATASKGRFDVLADFDELTDLMGWETIWPELVKEVAHEVGLPVDSIGTLLFEMPRGTAEAVSKMMSEVMRKQSLRFARKCFVSSDPYAIPCVDFESILATAEAWSGDKQMEDSDVYEKRREEHRRAASELPVDFILTPLLRIPYWKTPGSDRKEPTYTADNTNPAVSFLPTCVGKDAKGDVLEILDPTFNPYCILANVWETPSVTIPLMISLLRTPQRQAGSAPWHIRCFSQLTTPKITTPKIMMDLLFVAHKLSTRLGTSTHMTPYIKELWESDGVPEDTTRVVWPTQLLLMS